MNATKEKCLACPKEVEKFSRCTVCLGVLCWDCWPALGDFCGGCRKLIPEYLLLPAALNEVDCVLRKEQNAATRVRELHKPFLIFFKTGYAEEDWKNHFEGYDTEKELLESIKGRILSGDTIRMIWENGVWHEHEVVAIDVAIRPKRDL